MLNIKIKYVLLIFILNYLLFFTGIGFGYINNTFDEYKNIIELADSDKTDDDKKTILSYKKMLELSPQSYWTIAALNFMIEGPATNIEKNFEEFLKPTTEASKITLCTLYYYRWPKEFLSLIGEIENSPTIYGVYANLLLSFYYSGSAPDHPTDPEKGLSYLIKASKISNISKEVEISILEEIAGIYLMHLHKEAEGLRLSEQILKKVSSDSELALLFQNDTYRQELYIQMIIGYSKNNKKNEAKKYFDIIKKETPNYKKLDVLEKTFIDSK